MRKFPQIIFYLTLCWLTIHHSFAEEIIFNSSPLTKPDTLYITLQEAILLGLENSPNISIQRLTPDITKTYVADQIGRFIPSLNFSLQQSRSKQLRFLGTRPDPLELTDERKTYSVSISQLLPTGTTWQISSNMYAALSSLYRDQFGGSISASLTQPLLNGFGLRSNLVALRKAKLDLKITHAELKALAEQTTFEIERRYWEYYLSSEEVKIREKSLRLAERQLEESIERVRVGKLPELELAAVEAEVAARKSALIDAISRAEQARLRLVYLVNPHDSRLWNNPLVLLDKPTIPLDTLNTIDHYINIALQNRADLYQARLQVEKGQLEVVRTRNGLLPKLDFFITLGKSTYAESFSEAYPDIKSPYYNLTGGITFELPNLNKNSRNQYLRAKLAKEQSSLALKNLEKLAEVEIRTAYAELLRARQQIVATQRTRELQEKKLESELEKFRIGKSTNFLVLQAQRDLISSQLEEARTRVAYLTALANFYLVEGILLDKKGIQSPIE